MSALNQPGNLNIAQGMEVSSGKAQQRPSVALTSRTVLPSFMGNALSVGQAENLSLDVDVPALTSGQYGTATANKSFSAMSSISTSPWDNGQIVFHNVSIETPDSGFHLICGQPQINLVDGSGRSYPNGTLLQSYNHQGLGVQVTIPMYTPDGSVPGSVTLNLTGMLLGMATNH